MTTGRLLEAPGGLAVGELELYLFAMPLRCHLQSLSLCDNRGFLRTFGRAIYARFTLYIRRATARYPGGTNRLGRPRTRLRPRIGAGRTRRKECDTLNGHCSDGYGSRVAGSAAPVFRPNRLHKPLTRSRDTLLRQFQPPPGPRFTAPFSPDPIAERAA